MREQLLQGFKTGKEYRHAFVEEKVRTSVAAQIKAIREQRRLKQPEFAEKLGKSQSWVSRLEDPNQAPPTIPSLLKVAEAYDVDLEIRFGKFSELLPRLDRMTPESFEVPSFEEELASGAFEWRDVFSLVYPRHYVPSPMQVTFMNELSEMYCYSGESFTHTNELPQGIPIDIINTESLYGRRDAA